MKNIDCFRPLLPGFAGLICGITMTSCQTASNSNKTAQAPTPMVAAKWVKVSSQPPTYYPRGVSADCPTDQSSGEWVYTGDEKGTRYFIPLHGLGAANRQTLVHDALSARSERKLAEIAAEDQAITSRNIRNMVLFGPPTYAGLILAGMGGAAPSSVDIYRLQKEWYDAREPH